MKPSAAAVLQPITEKVFTAQVIGQAKMLGYAAYHTWLSARSAPGFPDLVLIRPVSPRGTRAGRVVFAELKNEKGTLRPHQEAWLEILRQAGAEVYVWRPADFQELVLILSADHRP